MELTLLHASDIHFGKHFDSEAADAFLQFLQALGPDLLVISGDFTQRAKVKEYEEASAFLKNLPPIPVVVTPGNHDVPLYRVWERLFAPHRNYRTHISRELDTVTRVPGAVVVSLDSTAPLTAVVNGRIRDSQLRFAARAFEGAEAEELRVLVAHHNLARAPDYAPEQVLPGHRRYLAAFSRMGVDLILGGHLHRSYLASSLDVFPQPAGVPAMTIVHTGTTTSRRGRARERGQNSLNLIRVSNNEITVAPHHLERESGAFRPSGSYSWPRKGARRE
ncbi:MAG: metallophosphoesterase [Gemmatimonadota bacterium]|jgi:3',5'-cyclic AMP phosphodiesterase CpdA